jgi:hypothetical protein
MHHITAGRPGLTTNKVHSSWSTEQWMMNAAGARAGGGADGITGTTSSKQMGLAGEVARFSAQRERLLGFFF